MVENVAFHWLKRSCIIELLNIEGKASLILRGSKETSRAGCTWIAVMWLQTAQLHSRLLDPEYSQPY
jgi:hypothetical protein